MGIFLRKDKIKNPRDKPERKNEAMETTSMDNVQGIQWPSVKQCWSQSYYNKSGIQSFT